MGCLVAGSSDPGPGDVLVVEPLVPYPGEAVGFQDEAASEDRRDVLCYTSPPLTEALEVAGSPVATVTASCDRPGHDVVVTLVLVTDEHGAAPSAVGRCDAPAAIRRWRPSTS